MEHRMGYPIGILFLYALALAHKGGGALALATQRMYPHAHINSDHTSPQNATNAASIDRQALDTKC